MPLLNVLLSTLMINISNLYISNGCSSISLRSLKVNKSSLKVQKTDILKEKTDCRKYMWTYCLSYVLFKKKSGEFYVYLSVLIYVIKIIPCLYCSLWTSESSFPHRWRLCRKSLGISLAGVTHVRWQELGTKVFVAFLRRRRHRPQLGPHRLSLHSRV